MTAAFRYACVQEAGALTELALRSKAHWGYSDAFMLACREELTVTAQLIASESLYYVVAEVESDLAGFYALSRSADQEFELEALFVEPTRIGQGIGTALLTHATRAIVELGGKVLMIQSDPNAAHFYHAAGGRMIGERSSASIPGRKLPLFRIELENSRVS